MIQAPRAAKSMAVCKPIPEVAPVITAVLPLSERVDRFVVSNFMKPSVPNFRILVKHMIETNDSIKRLTFSLKSSIVSMEKKISKRKDNE